MPDKVVYKRREFVGLGHIVFIGGAIGVVIGVFRYRMIEERVSDDPQSDEQPFFQGRFQQFEIVNSLSARQAVF